MGALRANCGAVSNTSRNLAHSVLVLRAEGADLLLRGLPRGRLVIICTKSDKFGIICFGLPCKNL